MREKDQYQADVQALIEAGRRLYARGMVAANDGNLSCRADAGFLVTASGVSKGYLEQRHILLLNSAGQAGPAEAHLPSSESKMHLAIYAARPDVCAIAHAHPPYATAFALAGRSLDQSLDEVRMQLGAVPLIPHAEPGSADLARAVAQGLGQARAALMQRHGAVTVGATIAEALYRMEALEQAAKIIWLAAQL